VIWRIFTDLKYFDGRGMVFANQDSDVLPFRGTNRDMPQVRPLFNEAIEVKGMLFYQQEILPNVNIWDFEEMATISWSNDEIDDRTVDTFGYEISTVPVNTFLSSPCMLRRAVVFPLMADILLPESRSA
jgi:hypothetical protein